MRARAASVRVTFPHQQPDSDNSHAKGSPHDSQVAGRWTIGPEGPQDMVHCIAPVYPRSRKYRWIRHEDYEVSNPTRGFVIS